MFSTTTERTDGDARAQRRSEELPAVTSVMSGEHPVVPGMRCNDIAVILAAAMVGVSVPRRLDGAEALGLLRAGLLACGGVVGVHRRAARDRAMNLAMLASRDARYTAAQTWEKRAIWGGGPRREQALIDLAFRLVSTPFATASTNECVERAGVAA